MVTARNNNSRKTPIVANSRFVLTVVTIAATSVSKKHGRTVDRLLLAPQEPTTQRSNMTADRSDEARYLRQKAKQFRELAKTYKTEISGKLLEIAQDLELRAENLEKGGRKSAAAPVQRRFSDGTGTRPRRDPPR